LAEAGLETADYTSFSLDDKQAVRSNPSHWNARASPPSLSLIHCLQAFLRELEVDLDRIDTHYRRVCTSSGRRSAPGAIA
jgi:hypothetical protein